MQMDKDLEKIYNESFDLIELRLNKKEQVAPFSVSIGSESEDSTIAMYEQAAENTADHIKVIREHIGAEIDEGAMLAVCLCYDVSVMDPRTNEKVDAITFELDVQDQSIDIFVPYDLTSEETIKTPFQVKSERNYFS